MVELIGALVSIVIVAVCFGANFYLLCQWLVYPMHRRRFKVCRPYLMIGWVLYVFGGAVLRPIGRDQASLPLTQAGNLTALLGLGLTVYSAIRLLRANAAGRRAARLAEAVPPPEGTWPPPPDVPPP